MTIEEKLKKVIQLRFGSSANFCRHSGIATSTLSTIFKRGLNNTTIDKLIAICDTLEISADDLLKGKIVYKSSKENDLDSFIDKYNSLSDHAKELIEVIMDFELDSYEEVEPLIAASGAENLTDEEREYNIELGKKYYELAHKDDK